jgi:hypothetical protein
VIEYVYQAVAVACVGCLALGEWRLRRARKHLRVAKQYRRAGRRAFDKALMLVTAHNVRVLQRLRAGRAKPDRVS